MNGWDIALITIALVLLGGWTFGWVRIFKRAKQQEKVWFAVAGLILWLVVVYYLKLRSIH